MFSHECLHALNLGSSKAPAVCQPNRVKPKLCDVCVVLDVDVSARHDHPNRRTTDTARFVGPLASKRFYADRGGRQDRKSTRLNSSHGYISYAVFCLKKKKGKFTLPHREALSTAAHTPNARRR